MFKDLILEIFYKFTKKYQKMLSNEIAKKFNYVVTDGPFKNLKLSKRLSWGKGIIGSKVLGQYEREIQELIVEIQKNNSIKTFLDLGAADGYFALGVLVNNIFYKSIASETSLELRNSLKLNANDNNVLNRLEIFDEFNENSFNEIFKKKPKKGDFLILCDIEGSEFRLFNEKTLKFLNNLNVIIEIHYTDFIDNKKIKQFKNKILKHFYIEIIKGKKQDFTNSSYLVKMNDIKRSLVLCEGRSFLGEWWHLIPKN